MKPITLLGIPLDLGAENLGVDIAPNAFRYQNIKGKLASSGLAVGDLGNITCTARATLSVGNPKLKYAEEIVRVSEESAKTVFNAVRKKERMIVLGGDHSISLGVLSGASDALQGDIGLIYCDTHGDMNTDKTTLTGNIHGMHLASLMGFGNKRLVGIHSPSVKIDKKNLLHIGANDLDRAEMDLMKKEQIPCYRMFDMLSYGLAPLLQLIDALQTRVRAVWVSLDLDVIDTVYAPGVGMQNKAGLTYREITTIAQYIGEHCNVIGLDVVEYNPLQDIDGKTAELSIELMAKFFGTNYSWYTHYLEKNKIE